MTKMGLLNFPLPPEGDKYFTWMTYRLSSEILERAKNYLDRLVSENQRFFFIPLEEARDDGQYKDVDNFPYAYNLIFTFNTEFKDRAFIDFALGTSNKYNCVALPEIIAYAIEHGMDVAVLNDNQIATSIFHVPDVSDMVTGGADYES
jgi:hypothetical protein